LENPSSPWVDQAYVRPMRVETHESSHIDELGFEAKWRKDQVSLRDLAGIKLQSFLLELFFSSREHVDSLLRDIAAASL